MPQKEDWPCSSAASAPNGDLLDDIGEVVPALQIRLDSDRPADHVSITPADGTANVGASTEVTVEFSESIDPATLTGCSAVGGSGSPNLMLLEVTGQIVDSNNPNDPCDDSNVVLDRYRDLCGRCYGNAHTEESALAGRMQHTLVVRGEGFDVLGAVCWRRAGSSSGLRCRRMLSASL